MTVFLIWLAVALVVACIGGALAADSDEDFVCAIGFVAVLWPLFVFFVSAALPFVVMFMVGETIGDAYRKWRSKRA